MLNITVIIPTHNRADVIGRALDSVLCQSKQPKQVIVVDDGSTDNTQEFLRTTYPAITYLKQNNCGVSAARNSGIRAADCDWIAFLDSDDEWQPDKLSFQMSQLENNKQFQFSHTDEIWIRNGRRVNPMKKHLKYGGRIFQHCLPLCVISPSSAVINQKIFTDVGLFNETLQVCEDYDLWLRICSRYPVLYTEKKLVIKYGGHSDQLSKKYWGMDRFRIKALADIIKAQSLNIEDRNMAIKMLNKKIKIYIQGAKKHQNCDSVTEFMALLESYPVI